MSSEHKSSFPNSSPEKQSELAIQLEGDLAAKHFKSEPPRNFPEVEISKNTFADMDELDREDALEAVTSLKNFLQLPYISDDFGTTAKGHSQRREYRTALQAKYDGTDLEDEVQRIFTENKYKLGNKVGHLGMFANGWIDVFAKYPRFAAALEHLKKLPELTDEIYTKRTEASDEETPWSYEELKLKLEQLEDLVLDILNSIAQAGKN